MQTSKRACKQASEQAQTVCADAVDLNKEAGDDLGTARGKNPVANGFYQRGDLPGAERYYQEALRTQKELQVESDAATTQIALVNLNIEKRDFSAAEKPAQDLLKSSLEGNDTTGEILARCILAQVFLGMRRNKEAEEQILRAKDRTKDVQNVSVRAMFSFSKRFSKTPLSRRRPQFWN